MPFTRNFKRKLAMNTPVIPPTPTRAEYLDNGPRDMSWLDADAPIPLFEDWIATAGKTEPNDPNAMSVATVDGAGQPDVRILLLKGLSDAGFVFYTNSESAKGRQLIETGQAALCFHWKTQKRQVRVRGSVEQVSDAESDAYFAERARGSRIGAWASDQWFGWRVRPHAIEFWQDGAFRVHDRILFTKDGDDWAKTRLYP